MTDMDRSSTIAKPDMTLRALFGGAFDWMWPSQSLISFAPLPPAGAISAAEFSRIGFLQPPWCDCCAFPFEHETESGVLCAACLARHPLYSRARAPLIYSDEVSQLILSLKRQGRRGGLKLFARWMYEAGQDLVDTADILVPVPLHRNRLYQRGFNQAGWLASAMSGLAGVPVDYNALRRRKPARSQGQLSPLQRRANVAGAFEVRPQHVKRLQGKRILLVDDVLTTGATVEACIRALNAAKPDNVDVIALARVVAPRKQII